MLQPTRLLLLVCLAASGACDASRPAAPGHTPRPILHLSADTLHAVEGGQVTVSAAAVDSAGRPVDVLGWTASTSDTAVAELVGFDTHSASASATFRLLKVGRIVVRVSMNGGAGGAGATDSLVFQVSPPILDIVADTSFAYEGTQVRIVANAKDRAGAPASTGGWVVRVSGGAVLVNVDSSQYLAAATINLREPGPVAVRFTAGGVTDSIGFTSKRVVVRLSADTGAAFVGVPFRVEAISTDADGTPIGVGGWSAMVTSDAGVAELLGIENIVWSPSASVGIVLGAPGMARVIVGTHAEADSLMIRVKPLPPPTTAMVVDSFTVIEDTRDCYYFYDCDGPIYVPLLKLREASGTAWTDVVAVKFALPSIDARWCRGQVRFTQGQSGHVHAVGPRPVDVTRDPLNTIPYAVPEGPVVAQAIVRDATGAYGLVSALGVMQRDVANPQFPPGVDPDATWECWNPPNP